MKNSEAVKINVAIGVVLANVRSTIDLDKIMVAILEIVRQDY